MFHLFYDSIIHEACWRHSGLDQHSVFTVLPVNTCLGADTLNNSQQLAFQILLFLRHAPLLPLFFNVVFSLGKHQASAKGGTQPGI